MARVCCRPSAPARAALRRVGRAAGLALLLAVCGAASAERATPVVPSPDGLITDRAGVIDGATRARLTRLLEELQQKTGAEIAVLTVDTTAPLDDFSYAMEVADTWKVGKKGEDTGVLVLVAVRDRKIRILTGYGVEGVLPDGLVGAIQDRYMLPAFRAGNIAEGVWQGVAELARRIAGSRGVTLTGAPVTGPRRDTEPAPELPLWVIVLVVVALMFFMGGGRSRWRGPVLLPGGGGRRGGFGGFGGGGGGFGGFGGGGFGGGGAGRSW